MRPFSVTVLALCLSNLVSSYNIAWSQDFTYYDGGSRNPYTLNLRGIDSQSLVICFEELQDTLYSGLCETAQLQPTLPSIDFGPKTIFQLNNASNPFSLQIYGSEGWTNYFLLAYTNGPSRAEGPGKVLMGQYLADGRIMYSQNQATFNPYLNDQSNLIELQNNSYFIVCASVGPRNEYDTACKLGKYDIEGMTIGLGRGVYNMSKGHTTHGMGTTRLNENTFLSCFGQFLVQRGVCFVGTVVGNFANGIESEIVFGNEILFDEDGGVDEIQIAHIDATTLVICYRKLGAGECRWASVEQLGAALTVVITPEPFDFEENGIDSPSVFRVPAGALGADSAEVLGVCYVDANDGICRLGDVDTNGNKIVFDEAPTDAFADRGTGEVNAIYLGGDKVIVCYIKFAGSTPLFNRGLCKYGTITM